MFLTKRIGVTLRRSGYLEYSYDLEGIGIPGNTIIGDITGSYIGAPSSEGFPSGATPFNFAGQGSISTFAGISEWKGFSDGLIQWKGDAGGIGIGGKGWAFSKFRTFTNILSGLGTRQGWNWNKYYDDYKNNESP